ncbi:MAG TPA: Gfo/Idh/MocA family oxidoreductase [Terriglobia bacterium]|nr:Gfo/Idh/MocA family oxidoreductase [Terriglobia bacterium]
MVRMGVIGYGYWGPNIVRNFYNASDATVVSVCDLNPKALQRVRKVYPSIAVTTNPSEVLTSPDIDAVAIVTPISHHFPLAKTALENGKHVFVEKPFTATVAEAEQLIELAERRNLRIMVDHTFLFSGAVRKIRELIDGEQLGRLYYYDSTRVNLGMFQHDANVVWDLATHDLAIIDHLLAAGPEAIVATGEKHVNGKEDMAFIAMYFPDKVIAHLNVNWLSPVKVRTTLIGGEKRMLVWNDLEADEKIKVYDKGVEWANHDDGSDYKLRVSYRAGDLWAPRVEQVEALTLETQYFVDCVLNGVTPFNDGYAGLRVVRMLEAIDDSISHKGKMVYCQPTNSKRSASTVMA